MKETIRSEAIKDNNMQYKSKTHNPDNRYNNMLNLPRPIQAHPMSSDSRAAQFSPFAALTGYDDIVKESARLTHDDIYLTETETESINRKLIFINEHISDNINATVSYFMPDYLIHSDSKKSGGDIFTHTGTIKKINLTENKIAFHDSFEIPIDRITSVTSDIFDS